MEEEFLLSKFGPKYEEYRDRVHRYLPSWRRHLLGSQGRFNWSQIHENGEINRVIHTLALIILFSFQAETLKYGYSITGYLSDPMSPFFVALVACLYTFSVILRWRNKTRRALHAQNPTKGAAEAGKGLDENGQ